MRFRIWPSSILSQCSNWTFWKFWGWANVQQANWELEQSSTILGSQVIWERVLQSSEMGGSGGRHFRAMLRINGLDAGSPIIPLRSASLDKKIIPSDFPQKATFPWEKGCSGFAPEYWCSTGMMNSDDWFHSEFKKDTLILGIIVLFYLSCNTPNLRKCKS